MSMYPRFKSAHVSAIMHLDTKINFVYAVKLIVIVLHRILSRTQYVKGLIFVRTIGVGHFFRDIYCSTTREKAFQHSE